MFGIRCKHLKLVFALASILAPASSVAQHAIVAAGGEASGSGGTMSFSAGLTDYLYYSSEAGSMQLGVQHPLMPGDDPGIPATRHLVTSDIEQGSEVCFDATSTISTAGPGLEFIAEPGTSIDLISGYNIRMLPGTWVMHGAYLHARITTEGDFCGLNEKSDSLIPLAEDLPHAASDVPGDPGIEKETPGHEQLTIKVYPNPTTGHFTLEVLNGQQDDASYLLEIIGMRGELAYSRENLFGTNHEMSLAGHPAGLYLLRLTDGKQVAFHRIIKR